MTERDNNKLPDIQHKGLRAKIRKGIFIVLSSLGIATLATGSSHGRVEKDLKNVEYNIDKGKRDDFVNSLKTKTNNERIIDEVIKSRRRGIFKRYRLWR